MAIEKPYIFEGADVLPKKCNHPNLIRRVDNESQQTEYPNQDQRNDRPEEVGRLGVDREGDQKDNERQSEQFPDEGCPSRNQFQLTIVHDMAPFNVYINMISA